MINNTQYKKNKISFSNINKDPFNLFELWFNDACKMIKKDPNACVLSTISSGLEPSSRVVLLKDFSKSGFVFFTNYASKKGQDISFNNNVCLNFFWNSLERQIRIKGKAVRVNELISEKYFDSRDKKSRHAAIVSKQSQDLDLDFDFKKYIKANILDNNNIKKPKLWGGYLVRAFYFEFWQGREYRFHDRLVYFKEKSDWHIKRLYP